MVTIAESAKQWRGIGPFVQSLPSWLGADDAVRIEAYRIYEEMYWNSPETFKLTMRGANDAPIYLPSARTIIDASNRFLAVNWDYVVDPRVGTPEDQAVVSTFLRNLFRREQLYTKFASQKRYGLIKGDTIWHVVADPLKPAGRRISVYEVDAGSYFPITDPDNAERIIGVHLADQRLLPSDPTKTAVRRQTYRKDQVTGQITTETAYFELGKWDDRGIVPGEVSLLEQVVPVTPLDPRITALPVYHIKNTRMPGSSFGSSELRGFELLMAATNQSVSDEDLSLALQGLGLYWTTSGPPVDSDGNETNWRIGPGRVVELEEGSAFGRTKGIDGLPGLDHIKFVRDAMFQAAAISDIAAGKVDVQLAESGIALQMQLAPLLAKNGEKEQDMLGVYDHMLYDLVQAWFPVYEQTPADIAVDVTTVVGDPMPVDRAAFVKETLDLLAAKVISAEYARQRLAEVGYDFPEGMGEAVVNEEKALADATFNADPFVRRVQSEILDEAEGGA